MICRKGKLHFRNKSQKAVEKRFFHYLLFTLIVFKQYSKMKEIPYLYWSLE